MTSMDKYFFLPILMISFSTGIMAFENEYCYDHLGSNISEEMIDLTQQVTSITAEISTKVLSIAVNHDGTGSVKVLTDEAGNLLGLRLDYKDSKGAPMQQTKTIAEFNKGGSVAFTKPGQDENPLTLKNKTGTLISSQNGGSFDFALLTDNDPAEYVHYPLSLVKVAGVWKVMKGTKVVTKTTIAPNISLLSWEGTSKSAMFQ
jgi:hypothetical protein